MKTDLITSKQALFIMYGSTVATGILSLPRAIAAKAYQDAWITVIVGTLIPLLSLTLINQLGEKFPDTDFAALNRQLMGYGVLATAIGLPLFYNVICLFRRTA